MRKLTRQQADRLHELRTESCRLNPTVAELIKISDLCDCVYPTPECPICRLEGLVVKLDAIQRELTCAIDDALLGRHPFNQELS